MGDLKAVPHAMPRRSEYCKRDGLSDLLHDVPLSLGQRCQVLATAVRLKSQ